MNGHIAQTVEPAKVDDLRKRFRGDLIEPSDERYDASRRIWNAMIDRRPTVIARCTGAADVVEAVRFAGDNGLLMAVRGGGHNVAGSAVGDGGLVVDLSRMDGVHVDPKRCIARVAGGAVWGAVDRETQVFGLATPSGYVSTTGVAGLTLGGGYGHLRRKYGLSCDNLVSVDIVTAAGQMVTASETENEDLFWGIRGGGGNFGIVTSFEFRLHPVGPMVYLCAPVYPLEKAPQVLRQWTDFMASAPDDLSSNVVLWTIPGWPVFPEEAHGRDIAVVVTLFPGDPSEGERITRPLRELGPKLLDLSGAVPYAAAQASFDPFFPYGQLQNYWKATNLDRMDGPVIDAAIESATKRPSPRSLVAIWHFGGALSRVEPTTTAFWNRKVPYMASFDAVWDDPARNEENVRWSRNSWSTLRKYSDGSFYVNFPGFGEEGEALVRAAYGGNYERLVALKNKYDPTNLFRSNLNVRPTGSSR